MKKLLVSLLLLTASVLSAQTTTVTAAVEDKDTTTWNNGTWKLAFHPNPAYPSVSQYNQNGSPLSPSVYFQNGSMDNAGNLSVTTYDSSTITPAGSTWDLTVCPKASAPCGVYTFATAGPSMNIASNLTAIIPPPRFNAIAGAYGYLDLEAIPTLPVGATYYNVNNLCQRYNNGSTWACGSSGGGPPTGAAGGDLLGTYPNPGVGGLKGIPFCTGYAPTNGESITLTITSSPNPCYTAITPSSGLNQLTGDVNAGPGTGSQTATVIGIEGVPNTTTYLKASGDTTGLTDGAAIATACTTLNPLIQLQCSTYYIGGSNATISITHNCKIKGCSQASTIIQNEGTTNYGFTVDNADTIPSGMAGPNFENFTIQEDSSLTPTAGGAFLLGHGSNSAYLTGMHMNQIDMQSMWSCINVQAGAWKNWIADTDCRNPVSSNGWTYNAQIPSGDLFADRDVIWGGNLAITNADTTFFNLFKILIGKVVFNAGTSTSDVVFSNCSIEGTSTSPINSAFDFSAGSFANYGLIQITNCEYENGNGTQVPINKPTAVRNLAVTQLCAGVASGTNSFCYNSTGNYQQVDNFAGTSGTALTSHTSDTGQTWTLYTLPAGACSTGTTITLTGSGSVTNTSGSCTGFFYSSLTPANANYTVCGTSVAPQLPALLGRISTGAATYYSAVYNAGNIYVEKYIAGTQTILATTTYTWSGQHNMCLSMQGSTISMIIDQSIPSGMSVTDSSITAVGNAGIEIGGASDTTFTAFTVQ